MTTHSTISSANKASPPTIQSRCYSLFLSWTKDPSNEFNRSILSHRCHVKYDKLYKKKTYNRHYHYDEQRSTSNPRILEYDAQYLDEFAIPYHALDLSYLKNAINQAENLTTKKIKSLSPKVELSKQDPELESFPIKDPSAGLFSFLKRLLGNRKEPEVIRKLIKMGRLCVASKEPYVIHHFLAITEVPLITKEALKNAHNEIFLLKKEVSASKSAMTEMKKELTQLNEKQKLLDESLKLMKETASKVEKLDSKITTATAITKPSDEKTYKLLLNVPDFVEKHEGKAVSQPSKPAMDFKKPTLITGDRLEKYLENKIASTESQRDRCLLETLKAEIFLSTTAESTREEKKNTVQSNPKSEKSINHQDVEKEKIDSSFCYVKREDFTTVNVATQIKSHATVNTTKDKHIDVDFEDMEVIEMPKW